MLSKLTPPFLVNLVPGPLTFSYANLIANILLRVMALAYNYNPLLRKYLKSTQGWINLTIGFRTENHSVHQAIRFKDGKVRALTKIPDNSHVTLIFKDDKALMHMLQSPPSELLNMLLKNKMRAEGNLTYLSLFNFYSTLLVSNKQKKMIEKQKNLEIQKRKKESTSESANTAFTDELSKRKNARLTASAGEDEGVMYLDDPYLAQYSLDDFPRVKEFLDIHFNQKPALCCERPKLLTDYFMANGYFSDNNDSYGSEIKAAESFKYLMENKKPIIRKNDLIAGTTTTKEIGVVIYPDALGPHIWGEMKTSSNRMLNPYTISDETLKTLHNHVFPYWIEKNFREWVRKKYNNPLCQRLDERLAVYVNLKTSTLSHFIPDFPKLLKCGTKGIIDEIKKELDKEPSASTKKPSIKKPSIKKKDTLRAMKICLEGLTTYAKNVAKQAEIDAQNEKDSVRRAELKRIAEICYHVPENPARSLDEALNAFWITFVGLQMENANVGISLGRVDQYFQPYFEADMKKLKSKKKKREYIKKAIEQVGCFLMRFTDHLPMLPDIGNYLFSGASSNQAITLGGITPDGRNAVNDMTYIFLKVSEMLNIRDPNDNARYHPGINSDTYLKRLCEVNYITAAAPSLHNDKAVMAAIEDHNYTQDELNDWAVVGCVEPSIPGKHFGHTNYGFLNIVAALEMALQNGRHPLMDLDVGPKTGEIPKGDFKTFDDFFNAFTDQLKFLIDQSIEYNNLLGEVHSILRPTPFASSLFDGCILSGNDVTKGGAKYNSSGSGCIGLADTTDSLLVIKKLVFDEKKIAFNTIKEAVDDNFEKNPALRAMAMKKVKFFGSGSDEAVDIANRIAKFINDCYGSQCNFRGGKYTAGFWTTSFHVAFGNMTGALPSGRLAGKAFTPGLTPSPNASESILNNMKDVARLDPKNMNNNIAFNVKLVPGMNDSHEQTINHMHSYIKTYFELGGMQLQFNVVSSELLRDAMLHPESYHNLLVRISGYNAYFVTLTKEMQIELIERCEYGM
ncbi:MAG: formate acetyltransferase [Desulfobacteraceae bacterium]|nr:formate acetyltransferase [Desulfobacteraceae bacterium]MBC2756264.1 formate acetyltransferase [Desulfobacteraceae bacterium]